MYSKQQIEAREARDAEKMERYFARYRAKLRKIAKGAEVSWKDGWINLTYPDGQVFKCRGYVPESVFGSDPNS